MGGCTYDTLLKRNSGRYKGQTVNIMKEKDAKTSAIIQDHIRRRYYYTDVEKQDEWQRLPEIPSGEEILHSIPDHDLPENPLPTADDPSPRPWKDKAAYLSAQYKLLREDAIRPLKIACQEFMAAPDLGDSHKTSIYTHVSQPLSTYISD